MTGMTINSKRIAKEWVDRKISFLLIYILTNQFRIGKTSLLI